VQELKFALPLFLDFLQRNPYSGSASAELLRISRELDVPPKELDIPRHHLLWVYYRQMLPIRELAPFTRLVVLFATIPTSSASVERIFSQFKNLLHLDGNQAKASPQLQAAALLKKVNAQARQLQQERPMLRRFKRCNRLKYKSRLLLDEDLGNDINGDDDNDDDVEAAAAAAGVQVGEEDEQEEDDDVLDLDA